MNLDDMVATATADSVEIDFSTALDFDPLEGDFAFVIREAVPGVSQKKAPKLTLKCEVISGTDINGVDKTGRKAQKDLPLTGEGAGITKKVLSSLGFDADEVARTGLKLSSIIGMQFIGSCRKSKFNEDFTDIHKVKPYVETSGSSL